MKDAVEKAMSYRFDEKDIKSVAGLLTLVKEAKRRLRQPNHPTPKIWFRGLREITRKHIPTFHREGYKIKDEIYMMNLFKQNAYESLNIVPNNEWEWMFLVRHHGLPSRLLDWTENPAVGLYFAIRPRQDEEEVTDDGVLWCLLPAQLNQMALGWPPDSESIPMFTIDPSEYSLPQNETIENYLPSRIQKNMPLKLPKPPPAAGICLRTNQRMQAQMSVFTIHHDDKTALEDIGDESHIWRYRVPKGRKTYMLDELRIMGITERTLFPNLDNVANEAIRSIGGH